MKKHRLLCVAALAIALTGCSGANDEPTLVQTGMQAIENSYYKEALGSFEEAIAAEEDVLEAHRGSGMAYMGLGDYEKAVTSFRQAVMLTDERMEDTKKDILYYMASAQYKMEDYIGTISTCDDILTMASEADARYLRGTCYLELEEKEKASVDFDAAALLAPNDYDLFLNIYISYLDKNLSAEGNKYLQQALSIDGKSDEDAYNKARIYYYLEDYENAKNLLMPLVEDKNEQGMLLMGKVYMEIDDMPHSRKVYEEYLAEYEPNAEVYNGLVLCDLSENNYDAALQNIEKGMAVEGEQGKQELLFNSIVAYEGKRDFASAKAKAQEYVERYPSDEAGIREYEFLSTR